MAWAAANCVYVYLFLGGRGAYRIESAMLIILALVLPVAAGRGDPVVADDACVSSGALVTLAAILSAGWIAIVAPFVSFPFLSDDYGFLATYRSLADVTRPVEFYRRMFALVFTLVNRTSGGSPAAFHLVSFALHLTSATLVYALARRLLRRRDACLLASMLFLFNPLQLEAVLWASGLQDLLWTCFLLAALVCYLGGSALSFARLGVVGLLIACALWSKETAIGFVLLLPAIDWLRFGFRRPGVFGGYAIFALELAIYLVLRSRAVGSVSAYYFAPSGYFFKQLLVVPYEAFIHPWNRVALNVTGGLLLVSSLSALTLFVAAAVRGLSRRSLLGPVIIVATTLPVYSFFDVGIDLAWSRYVYFAAAGFGLLVADCVLAVTPNPRVVAAVTFVLAAAWGASLAANLRPWRTAAEMVETMATAVREGRSADAVVREWQEREGSALEMQDGRPRSYAGV